MTVEFRPATPNDRDQIAALWFEASRVRRGGRPISQVDPELIRSRIAAPGAFGLVAESADVNTIAVSPERWGEGIARTLLDLVVDEARARGYLRIQLFTQDHNTRARDLYERNGWHLTGHEVVDDLGDTLVRFLREL
jgi:ribosomal protein S18 acetylase RimI-like enzyme